MEIFVAAYYAKSLGLLGAPESGHPLCRPARLSILDKNGLPREGRDR